MNGERAEVKKSKIYFILGILDGWVATRAARPAGRAQTAATDTANTNPAVSARPALRNTINFFF